MRAVFYDRQGPAAAPPQGAAVGDQFDALVPVIPAGAERALVVAISPTCHFCTESMPFYKRLVEERNAKGSATKVIAAVPREEAKAEEERSLSGAGVTPDALVVVDFAAIKVPGTPTILKRGGQPKGKLRQSLFRLQAVFRIHHPARSFRRHVFDRLHFGQGGVEIAFLKPGLRPRHAFRHAVPFTLSQGADQDQGLEEGIGPSGTSGCGLRRIGAHQRRRHAVEARRQLRAAGNAAESQRARRPGLSDPSQAMQEALQQFCLSPTLEHL